MNSVVKQLLTDIHASPDGPHIAAIFDFDGTIIAGYSATTFIREQLRRGDLNPRQFLELMRAMTNFGFGSLGFSGMMAINAQFMRGIEEQTYHDVGEALYRKQIARLIYPESRALVEAHLAKGHTVAIISSATPYQVEPAAADLGIDHVLCTHLAVEDGKIHRWRCLAHVFRPGQGGCGGNPGPSVTGPTWTGASSTRTARMTCCSSSASDCRGR